MTPAATALPTAPLVPPIATPTVSDLPAYVVDLLRREEIGPQEACRFLGIPLKRDKRSGLLVAPDTFYSRAARYRARVSKLMTGPYDVAELRPLQSGGEWTEIPNRKCGGIFVHTRLLVPMRYPEIGWPW